MASPGKLSNTCKDCNTTFSSRKGLVQCSFCEYTYCTKCTKLKQSVVNEMGKEDGLFFSCTHCRIAMPSIGKVLARLKSLEQRIEELEKCKATESCDVNTIKDVIRLEKEEEQDREERKLNLVLYSLPKSKKDSKEERKEDDGTKVESIVNETLSLGVEVENVFRLGKFDEARTKPRPVRFSVCDFDTKRKILDAAHKLQRHTTYSSVFITPDLTANQRKAAFELREETRRRTRNGETNLAIRKGRIVTLPVIREDHDYATVLRGRKPGSPSRGADGGGSGSFHH